MKLTVALWQHSDHTKSYCGSCGRKVSYLVQDTYTCNPCYHVAFMRVCNSLNKVRTLSSEMAVLYANTHKVKA